MKRALLALGALAFVSGASAQGGVYTQSETFNSEVRESAYKKVGVPADCITAGVNGGPAEDFGKAPGKIDELLRYIDSKGQEGYRQYYCKVQSNVGGYDYFQVNYGHVGRAIFQTPGYGSGILAEPKTDGSYTNIVTNEDVDYPSRVNGIISLYRGPSYGEFRVYDSGLELKNRFEYVEVKDYVGKIENVYQSIKKFVDAYSNADYPFFFREPFLEQLIPVVNRGDEYYLTGFAPSPSDPYWTSPNPTDPGTSPTAPACTKPDGSTSGNPYDCAPSDNETKCGIIDIPCNLKKLFIPRKDFLTEKMKDGVGLNIKFPLTVSNEWMTQIKIAGVTIPVGAKFNVLEWDEKTKDLWRFYAWWGTFLFLLSFVGVPFMSRKAMADHARDATEGAAMRQAAENDRIDSEYQRWRNTPWE